MSRVSTGGVKIETWSAENACSNEQMPTPEWQTALNPFWPEVQQGGKKATASSYSCR